MINNLGLKITFAILLAMLFFELFIITLLMTGTYTSPLCLQGMVNIGIGQS
jgi:polyferredoxin